MGSSLNNDLTAASATTLGEVEGFFLFSFPALIKNLVSVSPGQRQHTIVFEFRSSYLKASVKDNTKAFVAP